MAEMSNEMELLTLIDLIHRLEIAHKYLSVTMNTLNTTAFSDKIINFNVKINHRKEGMSDDCPVHLFIGVKIIFINLFDYQMEGWFPVHCVLLWVN